MNLNYEGNPLKGGYSVFCPNLGIDSIYSNLKSKYPDLNFCIIDGILQNLDSNQTKEKILDLEAKIVGFSTTYINLEDALSISRELKKEKSNIITALGGPGAKSLRALSNSKNIEGLDYCVLGDGERVFEEIVKSAEKCHETRYIKHAVVNLNSLEFPKRECFDIEQYIRAAQKVMKDMENERPLNIYTSKGCDWGKCVFCTVDNQYRARSPHRIKKELEYLSHNFRITRFFVIDDNFFSLRNVDRVYQLCNVFKEFSELKWAVASRVIDFTRDTNLGRKVLEKMKKSGCSEISWGIENGDDRILKNLGKGINHKDSEAVLRLATEVGITSKLFIMYNLPGENKESLTNTLKFLRKVLSRYDIDLLRVSEYVNIPGSIGWSLGLNKTNNSEIDLKIFREDLADICSNNNVMLNFHIWK